MSLVTSVLAPALGTVLANIMWVSPIKAILEARASDNLGNLNPIPFAVTLINCIGWTMYAVLRGDLYLFFANCYGIIISLGCCQSALMLLSKKDASKEEHSIKEIVEKIVLCAVAFWVTIALIALILSGENPSQSLVGIICDVVSISYYMAPLSTLYKVIKTRDASSLYAPTICANLLNAAMWTIYGLASTRDPLLWVPNGIGALLAISQLSVISYYGSFICHFNTHSNRHNDESQNLKDFSILVQDKKDDESKNIESATDEK
jgi:solute carrier family 50 protein (sugar transporter)